MGKIYLACHGKIDVRSDNKNTGLSISGIKQFESMGHYFCEQGKSVDYIYTSLYQKCLQSANAFRSIKDDVTFMFCVDKLNTKDCGSIGNIIDDAERKELIARSWMPQYEKEMIDKFSIESMQSVYKRLHSFTGEMITAAKEKDILIIGHTRMNVMLELILQGTSYEDICKLADANSFSPLQQEYGNVKEVEVPLQVREVFLRQTV